MQFVNIDNSSCSFFFTGFELRNIEGTEFLKINILERESNTAFSIYEKATDDKYDYLNSLDLFSSVDNKIYVVYKNGRLKFSINLG